MFHQRHLGIFGQDRHLTPWDQHFSGESQGVERALGRVVIQHECHSSRMASPIRVGTYHIKSTGCSQPNVDVCGDFLYLLCRKKWKCHGRVVPIAGVLRPVCTHDGSQGRPRATLSSQVAHIQ